MRMGVLVVGHGSKLAYNRDLVVRMAEILESRKEFGPVEAAFMQLNQPDIKTGIANLVKRGVDTIYVQPCFLASGIHLTEDIPGELGLKKGQNEGEMMIEGKKIVLKYCGPIGADERIADILSDRIKERMKKG
ncbi:MAG: sirohydrochlorin nickelochelatase [Methanomassiliicoccales archaeon]